LSDRRYRLRFLLQELDLFGSEVVFGRSPECHITLEDPLVSRRHARIRMLPDGAILEDLGSRNGVRVNGRRIAEPWDLASGDRIRIGTQELVFSISTKGSRKPSRSTGFMTICSACSTPYPEGSARCPHCGEEVDEPTLTGEVDAPGHAFGFDLLAQILDRAIEIGRAKEAERMFRRGSAEIDERLATGERLTEEQIDRVSGVALRLARLVNGPEWGAWCLALHEHHRLLPSAATIDRIQAILPDLPALRGVLEGYLSWAEGVGLERLSQSRFRRLQKLLES